MEREAARALVIALIGTYARLVVLFFAGWLARGGYVSSDVTDAVTAPLLSNSNQMLGALVLIVITTLWKLRTHLSVQNKIQTALKLPEQTTRAKLEQAVKEQFGRWMQN